jgi:hypothetical protein
MAGNTKTIMDMTPQELLKMFVGDVGALIKAENDTLKTNLLGEIKSSEKRQSGRMDALEQRLNGRMDALEHRLDNKMDNLEQSLSSRIDNLEQDHKRLEKKLDETTDHITDHVTHAADGILEHLEPRFRRIEEKIGLSFPHKN